MNRQNHFVFIICFLMLGFVHCSAKRVLPARQLPAIETAQHKKDAVNAAQKAQIAKVSEKKVPKKKRLVIFSSLGGAGHTTVSKALRFYLGDQYEITVVNTLQEVLSPIDSLGTLSFGKLSAEDFYNFCLRCQWTNVVAGYSRAGSSYFIWRQSTVEKLFLDYFRDEKPDLIISIMPMINAGLLVVAEKLDIPFLVITNDLDTSNYIVNMQNPTYKKFKYTLPFDDPDLKEKIKHVGFRDEQLVVTGFPLRAEFFKDRNTKDIKRDFNVPEDKPVVMVFMGGAGSSASYRYVRNLVKMNFPMHILVCLGRNERLRRNISKILLPDDVSLSIIGFTDRIADLMAISDVLITKTGPGSVCEALELNVPMLLDQTGGTIWWEECNATFMIKHGFAESINNFTDLPTILPKYLKDKFYTASIKKKMKDFKRERFDQKIQELIKDMIDKKEAPKKSIKSKKVIPSHRDSKTFLSTKRKKKGFAEENGHKNARLYR